MAVANRKTTGVVLGVLLSLIAGALGLRLHTAGAAAAIVAGNDARLSDMGGLGTGPDFGALNPAMAFNSATNEYLVIWSGTELDSTTEQFRIYGQRINAVTGAEVGTNDFLIAGVPPPADDFRDATSPAIAYNSATDEYLVVFVGEKAFAPPNTELDLYAQRVDGNGSLIGGVIDVDRCGISGNPAHDIIVTFGYPIDIAYNATNDEYLVAYRCDDVEGGMVDNEYEVIGQRFDGDGTLLLDDFQISIVAGANGTDPQRDSETPMVAWNSSTNQYLVVYGADDSDAGLADGEREIFGRLVNANGTVVGANDFQISNSPGAYVTDVSVPDVAVNTSNGEYLVVWSGDSATDSEYDVFGRRFTSGGAGVDPAAGIVIGQNGTTTNPASDPNVIYNARDNEFLVSWQASTATSGEYEVFAQRMSAGMAPIGPDDFRISDAGPNGDVTYAASDNTDIAWSGNTLNGYMAVWHSNDNRDGLATGETEIFGQQIDPVLNITKALVTTPSNNVDAGDHVVYSLQVQHRTAVENATTYDVSLRDAFNVRITDTLPVALTGPFVITATISDGAGGGGDVDVSSSFSVSGTVLVTTNTTPVDLNRLTNGTGHETLTVLVRGVVANTTTPGTTLNNSAQVRWENHDPGLHHPGYLENSNSVGPITTVGTLGVTKAGDPAQAAIGRTAYYTLTVTVVEGTTLNLSLVDTLPTGMTYIAGSATVANANGMTINGFSANLVAQVLTIGATSVVNPGNVNNPGALDSDAFTIAYWARVANVAAAQNGATQTNDADGTATGGFSDLNNTDTLTVIEPELNLNKTVDDLNPGFGQVVTYSVQVEHLGSSTANAHDVVIVDTLPANLTYVPGSASLPPAQVQQAGQVLTFTIPLLVDGNTTTFTYRATVGTHPPLNMGNVLTNNQAMTWTSLPGPNANERTGTGGVNDYSDSDTAAVTASAVDLRVTKEDSGGTVPGGTIIYTLSYTNTGNVPALGVVLTETVPSNTTFNQGSSSLTWSCPNGSPAGTICTFPVGTVNAAASATRAFAVTVVNPFPGGSPTITNTVSIGDNGATGVDYVPANNTDTDTTGVNLALVYASPTAGCAGNAPCYSGATAVQAALNAVANNGQVIVLGNHSTTSTLSSRNLGANNVTVSSTTGGTIEWTDTGPLFNAGPGNLTVKGLNLTCSCPSPSIAFSQSGGTLLAYANNITSYTLGYASTAGTANLRHNWWGAAATSSTIGQTDAYNFRLGADRENWSETGTLIDSGNGRNATLTAQTGSGTRVIVSHGRGPANAPFGTDTGPGSPCSDYYDFFIVGGSAGSAWDVTAPVDNTAGCNANTAGGTPGTNRIYRYALAPGGEPDPTCVAGGCWLWYPGTITRSAGPPYSLTAQDVPLTSLQGTPFVAGDDLGADPTPIEVRDGSVRAVDSSRWLALLALAALAAALAALAAVTRRVPARR